MASVDRERDAIVVRIVYDGPPTAGKTTSLRALAERLGQGPVQSPQESNGRTLFFDWVEYLGGRFEGRQIRCQIVSVPGQRELSPRRKHLLAQADAVVFVGDTSRQGWNESRDHLDELLELLAKGTGPRPGVVLQANKRDLPSPVPLGELSGERGLAVIESVASAGEGIREAFVFGVRLALDRVRELQRSGKLGEAPRESGDPAAALLQELMGVQVNALGKALWHPEQKAAVAAEAPSVVAAGSKVVPRIPDASIPSGWIWPPVQGRVLLQEATRTVGAPRELSVGEWLVEAADGWRFHSEASALFDDLDRARAVLIKQAQAQVSRAATSPLTCIALAEQGDGRWRLWQASRDVTK